MFEEQRIKDFLELAIATIGSQEGLATKIGVRQETISRWLSGRRKVSSENLLEIGKAMGWLEDEIKSYLIGNFASKPEVLFSSSEGIRQVLAPLGVKVLAQIIAESANLINQKVALLDTVCSVDKANTVISLDLAELQKLSQLVLHSASLSDRRADQFLSDVGVIGILAESILRAREGSWNIPEPLFDRLAQVLFRPRGWQGNKPIIEMPCDRFRDGSELMVALKSENGAVK